MSGIIGHDNFIVVMVGTKKGAYLKSSIRFNLFSTTTKYGPKQGNIHDSNYFVRNENQDYKYISKPQQKGHLNIGIQDVLFATLARPVKEYGSDI